MDFSNRWPHMFKFILIQKIWYFDVLCCNADSDSLLSICSPIDNQKKSSYFYHSITVRRTVQLSSHANELAQRISFRTVRTTDHFIPKDVVRARGHHDFVCLMAMEAFAPDRLLQVYLAAAADAGGDRARPPAALYFDKMSPAPANAAATDPALARPTQGTQNHVPRLCVGMHIGRNRGFLAAEFPSRCPQAFRQHLTQKYSRYLHIPLLSRSRQKPFGTCLSG